MPCRMSGIKKQYAYHQVAEETACRVIRLRRAVSDLDTLIRDSSKPSREQSLAFTKLEEVCHWGAKAITHNDPNSVPETGNEA
jgi:hypothetical protein